MPLLGFFRSLLSLLLDLLVLILVELETFHEHSLVLEELLAERVGVSQGFERARLRLLLWLGWFGLLRLGRRRRWLLRRRCWFLRTLLRRLRRAAF